MASVTGTFVPTYQGLSAVDFVRAAPATRDGLLPVQRRRTGCPSIARATRSITCSARWSSAEPAADRAGARLQQRQRDPGDARRRRDAFTTAPSTGDMQLDPDDGRAAAARCTTRISSTSFTTPAGRSRCRRCVDLCRRRGMLLVEDCALSLLSEMDGRPLGTLRRLVGLLPLQDAAAAERRAARAERDRGSRRSNGCSCATPDRRRCSGAPPNCWCSAFAAAPTASARRCRWSSAAWDARRARSMCAGPTSATSASTWTKSIWRCRGVSARLLERLDFADIRRRRVENYRLLDARSTRASSARVRDAARRRLSAVLPDRRAATSTPPRDALQRARRRRARVLERERGVGRTRWARTRGSCARTSSSCRFTRT